MAGTQPDGSALQPNAPLVAPEGDDPLMTLPNALTMARVPLGVLFCFVVRSTPASFAVMALAGLSDVLDGWLARRRRAAVGSERVAGAAGRGAWLDPLCDKLFLALVLLAIYVTRRPPAVLLLVIATRELLQAPLTAVYRIATMTGHPLRFDFRSNPAGKLATITQFVAVGAVLLRHSAAPALAVAAGLVGLGAVATYLRRALSAAARA